MNASGIWSSPEPLTTITKCSRELKVNGTRHLSQYPRIAIYPRTKHPLETLYIVDTTAGKRWTLCLDPSEAHSDSSVSEDESSSTTLYENQSWQCCNFCGKQFPNFQKSGSGHMSQCEKRISPKSCSECGETKGTIRPAQHCDSWIRVDNTFLMLLKDGRTGSHATHVTLINEMVVVSTPISPHDRQAKSY